MKRIFIVVITGLAILWTGCAAILNLASEKERGKLDELKQINGINFTESDESIWIGVTSTSSLDYSSIKQPKPLAVVLYFPNTELDTDSDVYLPDNDTIDQIRVSELAGKDHIIRIEILLLKDTSHKISRDDGVIKVAFTKEQAIAASPGPDKAIQITPDKTGSTLKEENVQPEIRSDSTIPGQQEEDSEAIETGDRAVKVSSSPVIDKKQESDGDKDASARIHLISFSTNDSGKSSIIISTTVPVKYEVKQAGEKKLHLVLFNTELPPTMDSTFFDSSVGQIAPVHLNDVPDMENAAVFAIKLRKKVPYYIKQVNDSLTINFEASAIPPGALGKGEILIENNDELFRFLSNWKTAWENTAGNQGNMGDYMSFYSSDFFSNGLDKNAWKHDKEKKNGKRAWIMGTLMDIDIVQLAEDNRINAHFFLDYKASDYSELIYKTLFLVKSETGWKIIREESRLASLEERERYSRKLDLILDDVLEFMANHKQSKAAKGLQEN